MKNLNFYKLFDYFYKSMLFIILINYIQYIKNMSNELLVAAANYIS